MRTRVNAAVTGIPVNYRRVSTTDLKEDGRAAAVIQGGFLGAVAAMVAAPFVFDLPLGSGWSGRVVAGVTVGACLVYMVLHEFTHGSLLWLLTGVRPRYAVRLPYLVTGSQALLTRGQAITVALAPFALWSVVLLGLLVALPSDAFLTVYVVLALNLGGSAGDAVQAVAIARVPHEALIRDDGTETAVFLPAQTQPEP